MTTLSDTLNIIMKRYEEGDLYIRFVFICNAKGHTLLAMNIKELCYNMNHYVITGNLLGLEVLDYKINDYDKYTLNIMINI